MNEIKEYYHTGNIGDGAIVQQGKYLYSINVQLGDTKDAESVLNKLKKLGDRSFYSPLFRRLDPIVLVNRRHELEKISILLNKANFLYVVGLAGIGKSSLVRGALELRSPDISAVWINCEGLFIDQLLSEINAGLNLDIKRIITDKTLTLQQKIIALIGSISKPSIIVFDNFESILNNKGHINDECIGLFFNNLQNVENKAKSIVTTRYLPHNVGKGSPGTEIMHLGGLTELMSKELFQVRSSLSNEDVSDKLLNEIIRKISGHPMFLELLASAISELPLKQIAKDLLNSSNIGEFIVDKILNQTSDWEMNVLRASIVFRNSFSFEALNAVYENLFGESNQLINSVRSLVRRSIFEQTEGQNKEYFLHPILRSAIIIKDKLKADAHAAAAKWFLSEQIEPSVLKTWEVGVYHLRRAAELNNSDQYFNPYMHFLFDNENSLEYAGWERKLIEEYEIMERIATKDYIKFAVKYRNAELLSNLGETDRAIQIYKEFSVGWGGDILKQSDEVVRLFIVIKLKYGKLLAKTGNINEAEKELNDVGPIVEKSEDITMKIHLLDLKYDIADQKEDDIEMYNAANESLSLTQPFYESEDFERRNWLAESHLMMARVHLRLEELDGKPISVVETIKAWYYHQAMSLKIKLEIGRLSGVKTALLNLAIIGNQFIPLKLFDVTMIGALVLTSIGINLQIQSIEEEWMDSEIDGIINQFLKKRKNIKKGESYIASISNDLVPYYLKAIDIKTKNSS